MQLRRDGDSLQVRLGTGNGSVHVRGIQIDRALHVEVHDAREVFDVTGGESGGAKAGRLGSREGVARLL